MLRAVLDPQTKRIIYKDDGAGSPVGGGAMGGNPAARGQASVSLPQLSVGPGDQAGGSVRPAPSMTMSAMPAPNPLASHLSGLEQANGLPQGYLAQIRAVESSNGRNLANPNSSARGPYQIISGTRNTLGLSLDDAMDEYKSSAAIAKMAGQDASAFQSRFGRVPSGADIYGMHQRGRQGYFDLLNGKAPQGAEATLNAAGGMDANGQLGVIQRMYQNAKPDIPGDPTTRFGSGFGSGPTLPNTPGTINAVSPTVTQGMGGDSSGGTPAPAAAPDPSKGTFNGGLYGLLQGDSYTGQGSAKDFSGKMGDFVGSDKFRAGMTGIATLLGGGGGGAPAVKAPGIQPMSAEDQENKPNMSLLQMLYANRGQGAGR
jgi:hypothetical protein